VNLCDLGKTEHRSPQCQGEAFWEMDFQGPRACQDLPKTKVCSKCLAKLFEDGIGHWRMKGHRLVVTSLRPTLWGQEALDALEETSSLLEPMGPKLPSSSAAP